MGARVQPDPLRTSLQITLSEDILFLHPTPRDEPAQDPVLQGT